MNSCVIIPARYASTRFPGKPLVDLNGKPMVIWVAERSSAAVGKKHVYIATDDRRIADVVESFGYQYIMTSQDCLTGTDRVAEASLQLEYDVFVNVQGDEPLVNPDDILSAIALKEKYFGFVVNGFTSISDSEYPQSVNIPKVVLNESNLLVYMSRSLVPGSKDAHNNLYPYYKQVCIYAFSSDDLVTFSSLGRKSILEAIEDIEILRFFEFNRPVLMFECLQGSLAVDVQEDIPLVVYRLSH